MVNQAEGMGPSFCHARRFALIFGMIAVIFRTAGKGKARQGPKRAAPSSTAVVAKGDPLAEITIGDTGASIIAVQVGFQLC